MDPLNNSQRARSDFIKNIVHNSNINVKAHSSYSIKTPKQIVQFWNDLENIPIDVKDCIESWSRLRNLGYTISLFDEKSAKKYILDKLGTRYGFAFDRCYHPAMQSDYFRLCYIYLEGGFYVDSDDVYLGLEISHLFNDGRLKLQPLCYDMMTDNMIPVSTFAKQKTSSINWIFYFNNNPLIAGKKHPIVKKALLSATKILESYPQSNLPEIQSTAGPGNITKSIFEFSALKSHKGSALSILYDWEEIATTKWPLEYRRDKRNWRLSNCQLFSDPRKKILTGEKI